MTDEKDLAFAEALYHRARQVPGGMNPQAVNYIEQARNGRYEGRGRRPAFLEVFGMTEHEWDALWALVYG
jgi:hypothetical protein